MNQKNSIQSLKIGVLGGGQLGRMLALDASRLGIQLFFLDKSTDYPAAQVSDKDHFVTGDFLDYDHVIAFGKNMDIVTIEIENVNTEALKILQNQGVKVYPQPEVLEVIKDKGLQKEFYKERSIATAQFFLIDKKDEIENLLIERKWSFPIVQKSRLAGYDGKGVQVITNKVDMQKLWDLPSVIEQGINIDKELAVIVARNTSGQVIAYDTVEMVFDEAANVLDYQLAPANITSELDTKCKELAINVAKELEIVGLLAVELFLDKSGNLLVNEVAPRTHNSGHHTIDAAICSQFEQQIRTISNLPFGSTRLTTPSFMINLLGDQGAHGTVYYANFDEISSIPEVKIHLYGKHSVKPRRKMGHVNVLSDNVSLVSKIKSLIQIKGSN